MNRSLTDSLNSFRNSPETQDNAAQNVQGGEARNGPFVATSELPEAVHPSMGAFHHPAQSVQVGILERWSSKLSAVRKLTLGDTGADAPSSQRLTQRPAVVAFVGRDTFGSSFRPDVDPVHGWQGLLRVVDVACREGKGEWNPIPIRHAVTLRRLVIELSRPADTTPPFLAEMSVESRAVWSQSMRPRLSRSTRSFSQIRCQVPSRCHDFKRRQQVVPEPYRAGTSFQGTPLVTTYQMPPKIWRSLKVGGRPGRFFRGRFGNSGANTRHSLSVNRRMSPPFLERIIRQLKDLCNEFFPFLFPLNLRTPSGDGSLVPEQFGSVVLATVTLERGPLRLRPCSQLNQQEEQ